MSNTKRGKTYTFWKLIQERPIVIPMVQRDYAYGRTDEKATEVRHEMLQNMKVAITSTSEEDKMTMDFIYGSVRQGSGMEPLDGQQRLTTLFLLHVYATQRQGLFPSELSKFKYETRISAENFCKKLVEGLFYTKDEGNNRYFDWEQQASKQIINSNNFLPTYKEDPTIAAMLVVLDEIQTTFADVDYLWKLLTETDRIRFYYLSLEEFGLSDDLYIKMNSRGKPLTDYELFKSKFQGYIEEKAKEETDKKQQNEWLKLKKELADKLDGVWTDMLWKNADQKVENVDNGFLSFIQAIIQLRYCHNNDDCSITEKYSYRETFNTVEDLQFLISFFDAFEAHFRQDSFDHYWNAFFYTSNSMLGKEDKIRLFRQSNENIFITAIRDRLTNADYVLLYAVYLGLHHQTDENELFNRFRIIRNLLTNSPFELRGKKIGTMLLETEQLICKGTLPSKGFNINQVKEEKLKASLTADLLKYENHDILRGSLLLFIQEEAVDLLRKFEVIFDEHYSENTPIIRAELLKWGDYSQYTKAMTKDGRKRYFVNRPQVWRDFFMVSGNRRNQGQIIDCLRLCADTLDAMGDKSSQYGFNDWQYYLINYDTENWAYEESRYCQGVYNWDDYEHAPLVINLLNSRSHNFNSNNDGYIEWNLLNRIYSEKYSHRQSLQLDNHGSAEVVLEKAQLSITAVQEGWKIQAFDGSNTVVQQLIADGFPIEGGIFKVVDADFILEAERLVSQIETYL